MAVLQGSVSLTSHSERPAMSRVFEAASTVRIDGSGPQVGIILGSGLGDLAHDIVVERIWDFADIPHFARPTAAGHAGKWIAGRLYGVACVAMQGRFHLYEGNSPCLCALPVRVMKQLGVRLLIVSNASGGLNPKYASGDVMIVEDHLNLMFRNPWIGAELADLEELGVRPSGTSVLDMSAPYDPALIDRALRIARVHDFACHRGVYAALTGPSYETRAEYRMLRKLGADVVGMSTIPEVLVASHAKLRVLALSAVTNVCRPDQLAKTAHDEVVEIAAVAAPKMRILVRELLQEATLF